MLSSAFIQPKPRTLTYLGDLGMCGSVGNTILFLLKPITTYGAYASFRRMRIPMIGYGSTIASDKLL